MGWELQIHVIDVGQGDCSLIIACNRNQINKVVDCRSMLIDGGRSGCASIVNDYVKARLNSIGEGIGLDHILVTNYDTDHVGGIVDLLKADNCTAIMETIAAPVFAKFTKGTTDSERIAFGACAAACIMSGAYKLGGKDHSNLVDIVVDGIDKRQIPKDRESAATFGIEQATDRIFGKNPILAKSGKLKKIAAEAGFAATDKRTLYAVRKAVFNNMVRPTGVNFQTRGIYSTTQMIDLGPGKNRDYQNAVEGKILVSSVLMDAPGIKRPQKTAQIADLGNEIFWNTDPEDLDPKIAPADAPAIFLVACHGKIWGGGTLDGSDNNQSIGLILRFNKFFYYTGGDLTSAGEEKIAANVMKTGLPNPADGKPLGTPDRIACFKCGHHGSAHSTSVNFLTTAKPRATMISCGDNGFGTPGSRDHPSQEVIDLLHKTKESNNSTQELISYFYFTNCRYRRNYVPASETPAQLQLSTPGNRSRISGDNSENNRDAWRTRGDIALTINQAESSLNAGDPGRNYHVRYNERDPTAVGAREDLINF